MKTKIGLFVVLALILALLPLNVFAAEPAELDIRVYNRTGAPASVRLTDADGALTWLDLPAEESVVTLTEGIYEYYAVTACGPQVGTWNVNVVKELMLRCENEMPAITLKKACPDNFWGQYWVQVDSEGHIISSWVWYWANVNPGDVMGGDWISGPEDCVMNKWDHW